MKIETRSMPNGNFELGISYNKNWKELSLFLLVVILEITF